MPVRWKYQDSKGIDREGVFQSSHDFGGTDVTYIFKRDDGAIDCVSGARLKKASRIWPKKNEEV
jgi:hypothetical protein